MSIEKDLVFVSFRVREALKEARELKKALAQQGYRSFVSQDDIAPGEDWPTALADNMDRAAMVVSLATETYGAKGTSTQGTFEELRYAKKRGLPLVVAKMCGEWKETRTELELGSLQCVTWAAGTALPATVLKAITDQLANLKIKKSVNVNALASLVANASLNESVTWDSVTAPADLKKLLQQYNIKPQVAKCLINDLGVSDINDLQYLDKEMVMGLGLKPIEVAAVNKLLQAQKDGVAVAVVPAPAAQKVAAAVAVAPAPAAQKVAATVAVAPAPAAQKVAAAVAPASAAQKAGPVVASAPAVQKAVASASAAQPTARPPSARLQQARQVRSASVTVHPHELIIDNRDNGWGCDGRNLPGGCRKGCTGFRQTAGWVRYCCKACDFDLCEGCVKALAGTSLVRSATVTVHPHELIIDNRGTGWICDGSKLPGGCRKGCTGSNQTAGWVRYCCKACDFDLCEGCVKALAGPSQASSTTVTVHPHELIIDNTGTGWGCDGRHLPGGCRKGCTGPKQTAGWVRYRCKACDFDLCEGCVKALAGKPQASVITVTVHPHELTIDNRDNGWGCDGRNLPGGCRKGCTGFKQTAGWVRYCCKACDFDLCEGCVKALAGKPK